MEVVNPENRVIPFQPSTGRRPARFRYGVILTSVIFSAIGVTNRYFKLDLDPFSTPEAPALHPLSDFVPAVYAALSACYWVASSLRLVDTNVTRDQFFYAFSAAEIGWSLLRYYVNILFAFYCAGWSCGLLSYFPWLPFIGSPSGHPSPTRQRDSIETTTKNPDGSIVTVRIQLAPPPTAPCIESALLPFVEFGAFLRSILTVFKSLGLCFWQLLKFIATFFISPARINRDVFITPVRSFFQSATTPSPSTVHKLPTAADTLVSAPNPAETTEPETLDVIVVPPVTSPVNSAVNHCTHCHSDRPSSTGGSPSLPPITTETTTAKTRSNRSAHEFSHRRQTTDTAIVLPPLAYANRSVLVATLTPQIRFVKPFNGTIAFEALTRHANTTTWPDYQLFLSCRTEASQHTTFNSFLRWFLRWNIGRDTLSQWILDEATQAQTFFTPATTYREVLDLLRILDLLPFIHFRFEEVFKFLTTQGALSHAPVAEALTAVFDKHGHYFPFFAELDANWWNICPRLPGKPDLPPQNTHFIRNGLYAPANAVHRRFRQNNPVGAVISLNTQSANARSYFSHVTVLPSHLPSTCYWDQGSAASFVTREFVTTHALAVRATGITRHFEMVGTGYCPVVEEYVSMSFQLPGLAKTFSFDFLIFDHLVSPILLGDDFWVEYDVLCRSKFAVLTIEGLAVPRMPRLDAKQASIRELTPSSDLFDLMLEIFRLAPPTTSLPPVRPSDYRISIKPGAVRAHNRPLPNYSLAAKEFLRSEVNRLLAIGHIEPSRESHYLVPSLVPKKTGDFRTVFDFRAVNDITLPLPTSLASFRSLMPGLSGSLVFSTVDLRSGYHQLRVHPSTKPYTAFNTPFGQYRWRVLPFGLCDAPQVFGSYMTQLLQPFDSFCRVYLDDILIFSPDASAHLNHVRIILDTLANAHHDVNWDKCQFNATELEWVGHLITPAGIAPTDTFKGQVAALAPPQSKQDIKAFIGHVGYLQDMIPNFGHRAQVLTDMLSKGTHFRWTVDAQLAFEDLKTAIIQACPLQSFDCNLPIQIHTDASKFAASAVLLQPSTSDPTKWLPIEYRSKKFDRHQRNWDIHAKEFWAIKFACEKFRFYIEGRFFTIHCDQKSISQIFNTFQTAPESLTPNIQRWMTAIIHYNFHIDYIPGDTNILADHLSRNPALNVPDPSPKTASNGPSTLDTAALASISTHPRSEISVDSSDLATPSSITEDMPVPESRQLVEAVGALVTAPSPSVDSVAAAPNQSWFSQLTGAYNEDPHFAAIYSDLTETTEPPATSDYVVDPVRGLLYFKDRLCVPRTCLPPLLDHTHSSPFAGHPGIRRWLQSLRALYFFPDMQNIVENYVKGCAVCQRVKGPSSAPAGLLQPVTAPTGRWTDILTDLITGLPRVRLAGLEVDAILTIVCKFSNRSHFYPVLSLFKTLDFVDLFISRYFPLHGFPNSIQSDRGPQFTNSAFQAVMKTFHIQSRLSLARHQQSNGRVENRNKLIELYLRLHVENNQDWPKLLPLGEFVLNSQISTSLGKSPFEVDLAYKPAAPADFFFPTATSDTARYATDLADTLGQIHTSALAAHQAAHDSAKHYFDQRHSDVQFRAGEEVYIDCAHLKNSPDAHNSQLEPKLRTKYAGPYTITNVLSPVNYELAMPTTFKGHPVFHISLLRLKKTIPAHYFTPEITEVPLKRYNDGSELVEITEIMGHRRLGRGYRLRARGIPTTKYPLGETHEYAASALAKSAPDLVAQYARKNRLPSVLAYCTQVADPSPAPDAGSDV